MVACCWLSVCVVFKDVVSPEEMASSQSEHPDAEFEGLGDYEESFLAEWWQEPKTKWDTGEVADWHLSSSSSVSSLQTDIPTSIQKKKRSSPTAVNFHPAEE